MRNTTVLFALAFTIWLMGSESAFAYRLGDVMASLNGVPAYSNGDENMGNSDYTRYPYQCVEYIKRYYKSRYKVNLDSPIGVARNYYFGYEESRYSYLKDSGLVRFPNRGNLPPKPGDIIVYDDSSHSVGHVGESKQEEIKINANGEARIETIEQNFSKTGLYTLSALIKDNKVTLQDRGSYSVAGWLGLPLVKFSDKSTIYLISHDQLWPILSPEIYCLLGFSKEKRSKAPQWAYMTEVAASNRNLYRIRNESIGSPHQKVSYKVVPKVGPNTGSSIQVPANALYRLGNDKKFHHIKTWEIYLALGYDPNGGDIVDITQDLFNKYGEGAPIETADSTGAGNNSSVPVTIEPDTMSFPEITVGTTWRKTFILKQMGLSTLNVDAQVQPPFYVVDKQVMDFPAENIKRIDIGIEFRPVQSGIFANAITFTINGLKVEKSVSGKAKKP